MKVKSFILTKALLVIAILLIGIGSYILGRYYLINPQAKAISIKEEALEQLKKTTPAKEGEPFEVGESTAYLSKLIESNPDTKAWFQLVGTDRSYPVMQTKDNMYYHRKNFEKKYEMAGSLYFDYRNKEDDEILIIYGHNMKNNRMFGGFEHYLEPDYLQKHDHIYLDFESGRRDYTVIGAVKMVGVYEKDIFVFDKNINKKNILEKLKASGGYLRTDYRTQKGKYLALITCDQNDNTKRVLVLCEEGYHKK